MNYLKRLLTFFSIFFIVNAALAQRTTFGIPYFNVNDDAVIQLEPLDKKKALATEKENPLYSLPTSVNLTLENAGTWQTLSNGDRVWHLQIEDATAYGFAVFYENFYIPQGAKLFMYDEDYNQVKGAYSSLNNNEAGKFMTGFVHAPKIIIEYYEPKEVIGEGHFDIFRIDRTLYPENTARLLPEFGFGASLDCNLNAACPQATDYQLESKGVCRIMMVVAEGTAWCTGTLINNVNNDEKPYVLSAFHCTDAYTPMRDLWRFDFNYQSSTCDNPSNEPIAQSLLGCTYRAGRSETDFQLLEINQAIPSSYNVHFNGWDRTAAIPQQTTLLHHPRADIKKYSHDQHNALIHSSAITWNNDVTTPANYHFRCVLDEGTFEIGSSGAALIDQNKRIVGQLHGGNLGCENATIYAGRLYYSWNTGTTDAEKLAPWLDPDNTGATFVDGLTPEGDSVAIVSGKVIKEDGVGVNGVAVIAMSSPDNFLVETDSTGHYELELPVGRAYTITYEKDYNAVNGVFTSDIVKLRRIILTYENFDSPYQRLAADTNNSESATTSDIVVMRQLILNIIQSFPNGLTSWRFIPEAYAFPDENNPWSENIPNAIMIGDLQNDIPMLNIIGIKVGDVNKSANPLE